MSSVILGMNYKITKKRPSLYINPSAAESGTFQDNYLNTMNLDNLAPWVAKASSTMLLSMQGKPIIVLHEAGSTTCA